MFNSGARFFSVSWLPVGGLRAYWEDPKGALGREKGIFISARKQLHNEYVLRGWLRSFSGFTLVVSSNIGMGKPPFSSMMKAAFSPS
jgi:hypothetical protein